MATTGSLVGTGVTSVLYNSTTKSIVQTVNFTSSPWVGRRQTIDPPNWTGRFIPGQFRSNPVKLYTVTGEVLQSGSGVDIPKLKAPYSAYGQKVSGDIVGAFIDTSYNTMIPTFVENDGNLAAINAEANLKSAKLDVGMMLAESAETLKMLNQPLSELVNLTNDLAKKADWMVRRSKRVMTLSKALGGLWLSYRYGWLPLANDVASIIEYASKESTSKAVIQRAAGSVTRGPLKSFYDSRVTYPTGNGWQYIGFYGERQKELKVKYTAKIYFQQSFTNPMSLYGMGPEQVPNLLWNMIPLSFVADWFGSFGDWLLAITPTPGTKYLGFIVTAKTESMTKVSVRGYRSVDMALNEGYYGSALQTFEGIDRRPVYRTPSLPAWKLETLDWKRSVDSLFLTLQKLPKMFWNRKR